MFHGVVQKNKSGTFLLRHGVGNDEYQHLYDKNAAYERYQTC